jgi:hypothetical protein
MDPLHQQILQRLAGELEPKVFEDCACDLLRDIYPSLVPVRGGHDAGMDGAIADGEGEALSLICTTREDFHRNLVESLDSYLAHGRRRRMAVFATSREVTPTKRRRLEDAAHERGFTLIQIVDQQGIAQRLYWSPKWLKELLGLSAAPSALSAIPRSRRPLLDLEPVGREDDLSWIRSTPGDLILAGEPGSGKTFLFMHLIREGWNGLFLVDPDRGEVKKALLEQRPAVVIVDDAHVQPEILGMLSHLRSEMGADFSLVATTWTWERNLDEVTTALPHAQTRKLSLLPRHQILEIFQQAGVQGSDELLRELVDQAANKPGLAATIAHLWKRGAWQQVLEGKTLHREVLAAFGGTVGESVEDLLAALSLGGDHGMGLEPVRQFLGLSRPEIRRQTAALAAGGVLGEGREDALSVWPRRLRTSLLRTVFFSSPGQGRAFRELLAKAPSFAESVREIALVHQAGSRVPEIHGLVLQAGREEERAKSAWRLLAGTGEKEARWVLQNYPGDLLDIAYTLLEQIPSEVIPRLLDRSAEEVQARQRESRAMSLLSSWVQKPYPNPWKEPARRREFLTLAAKRFLAKGGDLGTGVHGICLALKPNQEGSSQDPGLGQTVTLWSALLPPDALRRIIHLWDDAKDAIPALDRTAMQHLESALWDWIHPSYAARGASVPEESEQEMLAFALRVLQDLIPLAQTSPGLRARLARLADRLGETLSIELDPIFELLYPESYGETEPARKAARQNALQALAKEWEQLSPEGMAERLAGYEAEAERIGYSWPRGTQELCRLLAEHADDPLPWLEALLGRSLASTFVSPFLERLVRERPTGWEQVAERCLEMKDYQFAAIDAILKLKDAPPSLVRKALDHAATWPTAIEALALRREMPRENLRAALCDPRWEVALAAAVGEWNAGQQPSVPADLRTDWREAILRAHTDDTRTGLQHWLGVILAQDPDLALDWLRNRLRDPDLPSYFFRDGPFASAVRALRPEQRAQFLSELPVVPVLSSLLPLLVNRDAELYRRLFARKELWDYHLSILSREPDEVWSDLALLALNAGHSPEEVARVTVWASRGHPIALPGVHYWEDRDREFALIESHNRAELREIGRQARQIIGLELQRARSEQERISLRGL